MGCRRLGFALLAWLAELLDQQLRVAHGQAARDHFARGVTLRRRVGQRQQRACVSHRQRARGKVGAHFVGQLQQPHEVGDRAPVLPDGCGNLVLGQTELVSQPPIRQRLVHRVQVLALDVLDERQLEQLLPVGDVANHDRNLVQARHAARHASAVRRR